MLTAVAKGRRLLETRRWGAPVRCVRTELQRLVRCRMNSYAAFAPGFTRHTPPGCQVPRHSSHNNSTARPERIRSLNGKSLRAAKDVGAPSTTEDSTSLPDQGAPGGNPNATRFRLACPICSTSEFVVSTPPEPGDALRCGRCSRSFEVGDAFVDLTLTSGVKQAAYREAPWLSTAVFSNQLVSYAYERGYRQNPFWGALGFPGPDRELEMAMEYLEPAFGEVVLDLSCASGNLTPRKEHRVGPIGNDICLLRFEKGAGCCIMTGTTVCQVWTSMTTGAGCQII